MPPSWTRSSTRVIVLGGPVGDSHEGDETMLVVAVQSEQAIRDRLAPDPWAETCT